MDFSGSGAEAGDGGLVGGPLILRIPTIPIGIIGYGRAGAGVPVAVDFKALAI